MSQITVELNPWMVPNFCTQKMPPRPRQEGWTQNPSFALKDLDAETLSTQCDQFRAEVFRKAGKADPKVEP